MGDINIQDNFSIIGKIGINNIKLSKALGRLEATDINYGAGIRYTIDEKVFVDGLFEQITDKTINNRKEDISKTSIEMKYLF